MMCSWIVGLSRCIPTIRLYGSSAVLTPFLRGSHGPITVFHLSSRRSSCRSLRRSSVPVTLFSAVLPAERRENACKGREYCVKSGVATPEGVVERVKEGVEKGVKSA